MNILINYADSKYESARKWNTRTGRWLGKFDAVFEFGPNDVDRDFRDTHNDIFSIERGNGCWLWKSYFLNKVINECKDGDIIMYLDAGAFFVRDPRILFKYVDENNPIFVTDIPLIESNWTKPECFDIMDAWQFADTNQIQSGYIVILVNSFTRYFFKEYFELSSNTKMLIPAGLSKKDVINKNYGSSFVSHREDQSILSLLCKKHKIISHRDISQRGFKPESFFNKNYLYRPQPHIDDKYPTIVFLHKSRSLSLFVLSKLYGFMHLGTIKRIIFKK